LTYENVILGCWAAFLLVWALAALGVKRDIRGGYASVWKSYWAMRMAVAVLLLSFAIRFGHLAGSARSTVSNRMLLFRPTPALGWTGAVLTVIGIGFAVWARVALGRNWSPRPAVKEHHELVTSGPYEYVRHPIYSGIILSALGTALTGTVFGAIVFVLAITLFLARIRKEEQIMLELFPNEYPGYQARTKRLVPFIW